MTVDVALKALVNPYWDAVMANVEMHPIYHGPTVEWFMPDYSEHRSEMVKRYAWTITDPATVAFVADHVGERVIDPMAGTGYWGYLLGQVGIDVLSSDEEPPADGANDYRKGGDQYVPVARADAVEQVAAHGADRTLFLAWPPYGEPLAAEVLAAYTGDRVVYIGEGYGGCCGDDDMFRAFERDWREVAEHRPVQWSGIHDYVTVYERKVPDWADTDWSES